MKERDARMEVNNWLFGGQSTYIYVCVVERMTMGKVAKSPKAS